jgi:hypothetical protein
MKKTFIFTCECVFALMFIGWLGAETVTLLFWLIL